MNPIQIENANVGNSDWQLVDPAIEREIEGYASKTSYNRGEDVIIYVSMRDGAAVGTDCTSGQCPGFEVEVFRMGWYAGAGARRVLGPQTVVGYGQLQPVLDSSNVDYEQFGLIECQWDESFRFSTESSSSLDWVSGIYLVRLTATDSGKQSYITFAIRDDERASDFLFQQSVTTYQAYNNWPGGANGGKSTYPSNSSPYPCAVTAGGPTGEDGDGRQAVKVSFNRPYGVRNNPSFRSDGNPHNNDKSGMAAGMYGVGAGEFLTTLNHRFFCSGRGHEYNFVRFLERDGYDVSYATNIDVASDPMLLSKHKAFLSVGHDEYWSKAMRDHVEMARDDGLNLGFFSANTCFIQVRLEDDARTMVVYKSLGDPCASTISASCPAETTMLFRSFPVSRPEHTLLGVAFRPEGGSAGTPAGPEVEYFSSDMILKDAGTWVTADTSIQAEDRVRALVGYEVDTLPDNSADWRPGIKVIAESPIPTSAKAHMVTFDAESGATTFSTGSIQWSLGLDDFNCDPVVYEDSMGLPIDTELSDDRVLQITRNVLDRFRSRDRTDIFARGADNAIYWLQRSGGTWQSWQSIGGGFISAPSVSSTSADRLRVFAVGLDSQLYQNSWNGSSWSDWSSLGAPTGHTLTSNPAAISRDRESTDIFVRASSGSDSSIWHRHHDGSSWSAWQSLGGGFNSGPAASTWNSDQMLVFAIGLDGDLWNKQWISGTWSDWVSLGNPGGAISATPAAVSRGSGSVDVFVRGSDQAVWHRRYDAGWQSWQSLGGGFNSGPGAASWHKNKIVVAGVGLDNQVWVSEWTGSAWTSWSTLGGTLTSAPALACWYGTDR